ncbi:MAG: hypothetical protein HC874_29000 [Richelia sp. SL_2_1]|nr:hypothetical protein [Richelia sp. SL_2_1]
MSNKLSLHIPQNWTITKLENLVTKFMGGGTPSRRNSAYYQGNIPWMTVKDMTSHRPQKVTEYITLEAVTNSATNLIPPDTIIIATRMSLGKVVRVPFEVAINQDLKALILPNDIEKDFLEYWYISEASNIQSLGTGTTVKGIRLEVLQQLKIPLPPLNEQKRIVGKIEALQRRSQRVKEAIDAIPQLLDQFRQSVFAAAFRGDLTADWRENNPDVEPASMLIERMASQMIRGKETGRAATINVIPGRAALSVGNTQIPVPKNWFRVPLLKIARLESGHTPSRKHPEYWDGDIPWIGIVDAREHHGKYIFDTLKHTNEKGLANSAARLLPKNTVCLSRTASVGYAVIMGQQMATSQDFVNWICNDALLPEFLL